MSLVKGLKRKKKIQTEPRFYRGLILGLDAKNKQPVEYKIKEGSTSSFLFTINNNKKCDSEEDKQCEKRLYLKAVNALKSIFKEKKGRTLNQKSDLVVFNAFIETGTEVSRIHSHIFVKFNQFTRLDFDVIRELLNSVFGRKVYFNCKFIKDAAHLASVYAGKNNEPLSV